MLDFIKERVSSWERLKNEKCPIYIYGMGNGAQKILNELRRQDVKVKGIFASDEFVRGHKFAGFPVEHLADIEARESEFAVVLAFAAGYPALIAKIENIARKHKLYVPDVPVFGAGLFNFDYCLLNRHKIQEVFDMLEDGFSKKTYADIINFKISGDISYLRNTDTTKDHIYKDILNVGKDEIFVDLGAYNGDSIAEFLRYTDDRYLKIYAFEPDVKNFRKLERAVENLRDIEIFNNPSWSIETELPFIKAGGKQSALALHTDILFPDKKSGTDKRLQLQNIRTKTVDSLDSPVTYIKMDVEGAEFETLWGASSTIAKYKPKLVVSLYHRNEDMFSLPLLVKSLNMDYKLLVRHLPYIPAWETNLYAIMN